MNKKSTPKIRLCLRRDFFILLKIDDINSSDYFKGLDSELPGLRHLKVTNNKTLPEMDSLEEIVLILHKIFLVINDPSSGNNPIVS